jgi:ATP-binding cassette, subfamily B, bacterial PglK
MINNFKIILNAFRLFPDKQRRLLLPVVSLTVSNSISLFIPLISIQVIDSLKNSYQTNLHTVGKLFIVWSLSLLIIIILDYYQSIAFRKNGHRIVKQIYQRLINNLKYRDYLYYLKVNEKEEAENIKRNLEDILPLYSGIPFMLIRHVIVLFVTLIIMLVVNWRLMLSVSLVFPFYLISLNLYHNRLISQYWYHRKKDAAFLKNLIEFKQAAPTYIYLLSFNELVIQLMETIYDVFKQKLNLYITMNLRRSYSSALSSFIPVYVIFIAFIFISLNLATPGQIFGFWAMFSLSVASLGGITAQYSSLLKALTVYQKIQKDIEQSNPDSHHEIRLTTINSIKCDSLLFSYDDTNNKWISFPSFCINRGDRVQIQGSSGSGKTTLIRMIIGLLHPRHGEISINGFSRSEICDETFFEKVGFIEQNSIIYSGSLKENILVGRKFSHQKWYRSLEISGLEKYLSHPEYINTDIGESGIRLSGGERQRILLARALYHQPEWIFLDEPFNGIDTETKKLIEYMISNMNEELTLIVVSHEKVDGLRITSTIYL